MGQVVEKPDITDSKTGESAEPRPLTIEDVFARVRNAAYKIHDQSAGHFIKIWIEPDDMLYAAIFFAYHDNCMIVPSHLDADVILVKREQEQPPHMMGLKDGMVFVPLFKPDENLPKGF